MYVCMYLLYVFMYICLKISIVLTQKHLKIAQKAGEREENNELQEIIFGVFTVHIL